MCRMDSLEDGQLPAKPDAVNIATNPGLMSSFEELPPELVFAIFDHVPEAIRELRLVSI